MGRTCFLDFRKLQFPEYSLLFRKDQLHLLHNSSFRKKTSFLTIYSDFQKGTSPLTQMKKNLLIGDQPRYLVLINHSSRIVYITLHTPITSMQNFFFPGNIARHIYGEISNYEYIFQFPLLVVTAFYGNPCTPLLKAGSPKQRMSLSINHLPVCAHFTPSK